MCFLLYHQERALLSCKHTPAWELPMEINNLEVEDLFNLVSDETIQGETRQVEVMSLVVFVSASITRRF